MLTKLKQSLSHVIKLTLFVAFISVPFSTHALADDVKNWRKAVIKKIIKKHVYPRSAIQREIEGAAKVRLTIDRTGEITNYEVVQASGESVLDKAIPKMMDRLNPLPAPPDSLSDARLSFVIPISWRLQ